MGLLGFLEERLVDHRDRRGRYYRLSSLILLVLVGFMSGRNSVRGIARFGASMPDDEFMRLGFRRKWRRPSQATLCIQLQDINPAALIDILNQALCAKSGDDNKTMLASLNLDGKRLRATRDTSNPENTGIHILQAFAEGFCGLMQQRRLLSGENEITAMLDFLDSLELEGKVITGDAIFAQKHICGKIKAKGGHYMFPVKDNQKSLKAAVKQSLEYNGKKNPQAS